MITKEVEHQESSSKRKRLLYVDYNEWEHWYNKDDKEVLIEFTDRYYLNKRNALIQLYSPSARHINFIHIEDNNYILYCTFGTFGTMEYLGKEYLEIFHIIIISNELDRKKADKLFYKKDKTISSRIRFQYNKNGNRLEITHLGINKSESILIFKKPIEIDGLRTYQKKKWEKMKSDWDYLNFISKNFEKYITEEIWVGD